VTQFIEPTDPTPFPAVRIGRTGMVSRTISLRFGCSDDESSESPFTSDLKAFIRFPPFAFADGSSVIVTSFFSLRMVVS